MTTSRLIWLAALIGCASAISAGLQSGSLSNTRIPRHPPHQSAPTLPRRVPEEDPCPGQLFLEDVHAHPTSTRGRSRSAPIGCPGSPSPPASTSCGAQEAPAVELRWADLSEGQDGGRVSTQRDHEREGRRLAPDDAVAVAAKELVHKPPRKAESRGPARDPVPWTSSRRASPRSAP